MKIIFAIVVTLLITGPIGIVVGYKMAEIQQYPKGKAHGRADTLEQLHADIRSNLSHRVAKRPTTDSPLPKLLYSFNDKVIYVTEIDGVLTLATSP